MDFFQAQHRARQRTGWLVFLFTLAVLAIIVGLYLMLHFFYHGAAAEAELTIDRVLLLDVVVSVLAVVTIGSLYKTLVLSGGGARVAEAMGGRLLYLSTKNEAEKRLLNIVEEMALASGVPVPQVYLIPDDNINAFAAGTTLQNAVIGVTRGALKNFTRDEMQGVIAHEFSHILNGDMRLNIRLTSVLHGIMLLGYFGYFLLRASMFSSGRDRQNPLPLIGLALIVVGFAGTFFGSWIRAAVSRQREYLADAAAVQFTRNPHGIAAALERIGLNAGLIERPQAAEFAHFFFSSAVAAGFSSPFASHPPLENRIKSILPEWDGKRISTGTDRQAVSEYAAAIAPVISIAPASDIAPPSGLRPEALKEQIGTASAAALAYSADFLAKLPKPIARAMEDPYSARALIYAMLLDKNHEEYRQQQLTHLEKHADKGVYPLVLALAPALTTFRRRDRLPLVQMALPALRALSPAQRQQFLDNLAAVIAADAAIELFEWCVQAIVTHDLQGGGKGRATKADSDYALALLAQTGGSAVTDANAPFEPRRLYQAMQRLAALPPKQKSAWVDAAVKCVTHDNFIAADEEDLLRAYLMILDCPLPIALNGGQ